MIACEVLLGWWLLVLLLMGCGLGVREAAFLSVTNTLVAKQNTFATSQTSVGVWYRLTD